MAGGNVFRRYLEIVLDKASAKKTERDAQASIDRATNSKGAAANLSRVSSALNSVTRLFLQAGAAAAGYVLALGRLTERGGQVLNVQRAFTRAVGDADAALATLRKSTNGLISDYELMVGFNKALSLGAVQTIEQFGEMASVARDLGKALGVDASYAMEQLSLGIARHSIKILDNIGITAKATDDFATIMDKARARVDQFGASSTNAADLLQRAKVQFGNFRDEIGKFLARSDTLKVAFFEAGNVLETLVLSLQTGDIEDAKDAFAHVGKLLGSVFASAFADALKPIFEQLTFKKNALLPGLVGGAVGFAVGGIPGAVAGAAAPELIGRTMASAMGKVSDEATKAAEAEMVALGALNGQVKAALQLRAIRNPPGTGTAAGSGVAGNAGGSLSGFSLPGRTVSGGPQSMTGGFASPVDGLVSEFQLDRFEKLTDKFRTGFSDIESAGQTAALGLEDAFSSAFRLLGDEGVSAGDLLTAVFRGVAESGLTALAQYATGKVTEDIAHAFDEFAKASASAASFDPVGAALHTKAAHGFLLGAAKWALAGGAASAAASAAGGGASSFRGSDVTGRQIDKLDRGGPEIHLHIDGVDPTNPRHQKAIGETAREYAKAYGGRITVDQ